MQDWVDQHQSIVWIAFPIYFASLWLLVSAVVSYIGGWTALAKEYRVTSKVFGERWTMQSGQMRWLVGYGNCLTVGSDQTGLYLAVLPLFRFRHPPLLIPWERIAIARRKVLFFHFIEFRLGGELRIPLWLHAKLGEKLLAAAGDGSPIEVIG